MKYLVTSYYVSVKGGIVFLPELTTEVFDHYFSACRWLVKQRRIAKICGYLVSVVFNEEPSKFGREWFVKMTETSENGTTFFQIASINENGFH